MTVPGTNPTERLDGHRLVDGVLARYAELAELANATARRGPASTELTVRAAPWIAREARLLDAGLLEDWLDGFTDDAVVWVPLDATSGPGQDQSLYLDDRRRLGERVAWHREPSAWGQHPPSVCTRVVGSIEAWPTETGDVVARSAFTLVEHRRGRRQVLAGHQIHELVGSPWRCRTKVTLVPDLRAGVRNPSFLL